MPIRTPLQEIQRRARNIDQVWKTTDLVHNRADHMSGPDEKIMEGTEELVLKIRKQSPRENDFIEIELDRQKLTYQNLMQVSCRELGINLEQVMKIRKLPNTLLRKDKDVSRLQEFQELELILVDHGMTESTPSLIEKPCYNHNATKMTY